ncbi:glycoside hydrolase family 97 catalytic domain-containing protein [Leifsonia sp. NPDC058248]|uniref:glycoside hydrolase family 97 catalytic domain-containing protein n=1 Tax=Leifsonia sp. NPDC058248 TaxID=3346402 RepID=UPI0036D854E0
MVTDTLPITRLTTNGRAATIEPTPTGLRLALGNVHGDDTVRLRLRLGVTVGGTPLAQDSVFVRSSIRTIVEELTPVSGKSTIRSQRRHEELTATFASASGLEWQLVVRLAEDGLALRYVVPDLQGLSTRDAEATAIELDDFDRAWMLAYQTWYETPRFGQDVSLLSSGAYGFPVLLRSADDGYVLVTEAGIDGRFSGSHASLDAGAGTLTFQAADSTAEIARGAVTPWRVFILGTLADVVESRLVDELAPPQHPSVGDPSWVRPGRAAWSWWSDFYSGAQLERQKHFVDAAARLGWEHLLIDCGWEETWVPEIVSYASRFGIQVHLWAVWHDLDGPEKLERLALWRSWGVAGIKVDFMESESKDRYRWYDSILQETARLGLMVNFHGSVIPRGWARTWPQVIGYEAIRGSEYYVFYNDTPLTAEHNVIQPFTRNIVGAMDYTPVAFGAPGRSTSDGHELGLSVAYECGITHFADSVDTYLARPLAARFLAELAPSWDETRLLSGTPDTEAVIARRSGDRWFVGGIATGGARAIKVPLGRLGDGRFDVWTVTDAPGGAGRGLVDSRVVAEGSLTIPVAENGGFAAVIAREGTELFRAGPVTPEETPNTDDAVIELDAHGRVVLDVEPGDSLRLPPRWRAAQQADGRWAVQAPDRLTPGELGIVAVERTGRRGVPLVSHLRVIQPLAGTAPLSSLPMLSFTNESGPVERDQSNGGGNPRDGQRMSIAGDDHATGLGVSSPSELSIHLGARAERMLGVVGIDDETPGTAAVAIVEVDGHELARFNLVSGQPATPFDLDLSGGSKLVLRTEPRSDDTAHVDWASTVLTSHHPTQSHNADH